VARAGNGSDERGASVSVGTLISNPFEPTIFERTFSIIEVNLEEGGSETGQDPGEGSSLTEARSHRTRRGGGCSHQR
jgi:hypothetical protein